MRHLILAAVIAAILFPVITSAAYIDPNLIVEMDQAGDDYVSVLIIMKDKVDLDDMVATLSRKHASLASRHYDVITALQEKAALAQTAILSSLAGAQAASQVKNVKSFWISNMIAVQVRPAFVERIAARADVKSVLLDPPIELIEPVSKSPAPPRTIALVENGVLSARAPEMWALGYDGSTALACDQDTGADGTHVAFANRWLGLEVPPAQAWFDPLGNETFPTESWGNDHGTHTLGTMVGNDGMGNQIGMAPAAKWIGTKTIDTGGEILSDAVAAFQWSADPDGNPATMDDVPDVINNSWGLSRNYYGDCRPDFNDAIDAAEAAGVVVVFAAGNEGPETESLRSPGNRIATAVSSFAVGALEQDGETIADFSSRGPSDCDHATIKPEVSAVGVDVRSAMPGDEYQIMSGTSMACPHVAGAVLLLRDAFPDTPPEDVKWALYITAVDLGVPGEDNTFGRGRIDVMEAYAYLLSNTDCDRDGDTFDSEGDCGGNDCNDYDPDIHPGHAEICGDNKDNDCNDLIDADDPGVVVTDPEVCGDGADNNCNNLVDYEDPACLMGGPDAFGYTWDYSEPYVWNDVSDGALGPQADDVASSPVSLGFNFAFYTDFFDATHVTTNGHVSFSGETRPGMECEESQIFMANFAGLWLDLDTTSVGAIYYKTTGEAPTRHFTTQWDAVPVFGDSGNTGTFQVVLEEGSNDIIIYIQDGYVGKSNNILIRGSETGHYLSSHCGEFMPANGMAVRFKYPGQAYCLGCWIDGICFSDDAKKPYDPCLICDVDQSQEIWSHNDGVSCDDGAFCNGNDQCQGGTCSDHDGDPCSDDGLFCNGEEYCDELADGCDRQNAPDCVDDGLWCNGEEFCDEDNNECGHRDGLDCPGDDVFCNGEESCDEESKECLSGGNPCLDGQICDEENGECITPTDDDSDDDASDDDTDVSFADDDDDDDNDDSGGKICSFL